ncbi:5-formyltetrahydrofolate cyclo-ligase [Corynebacterium sp. TAE3-ERU16]|uniref:5-formyltetrahydrofolate cyclo-ligase n=1 Tax=Corynebacterium sp. TAE3-ERU16 TaxID=2849493 RepID=UPI001C4473DB|nr:5-formyltetrahydrofolate cyclo-ligase [Corynebacterium sp. TAE3-ERU16]MBV7293108.1 5-formyltetrahydrofolate cyclo-ligase [Corynebacterium sp. TAE3-ERU16]
MDIRTPETTSGTLATPREVKEGLRRSILDARATTPPERRRILDTRLVEGVLQLIHSDDPTAVAAYSPMSGEPGGGQLVGALLSVLPGIWLPVSGAAGRLSWAFCESIGDLHRGRFGITEPAGPAVETLPRDVELLLCPALACSVDGVRLGRGAGYFDRALAGASRNRCRIIALTYDSELLDRLPAEAHDEPVDGVLTPGAFHNCVPSTADPGTSDGPGVSHGHETPRQNKV